MTKKIILKNKKILITGGSGFVGSYLLDSLIKKNKICIIDNQYRGSNLEYLKKKYSKNFDKNLRIEKQDIVCKEKTFEIFKEFKPEVVFHLAAIAGVDTVLNNPFKVINVNLIGSFNIFEIISKTNSVEKIIYSSTSEVYGPSAFKLDEDTFTTQGTAYDPRWSYATSKMFAEHIFVSLERQFGIDVSIGRLFNVYGPRQIGSGAIHNFIVNAFKNKPLIVNNDGSQIRAWCYIDDCVNGLLKITEKGNGIYNIGNPHDAITTLSLANLIIQITKSKSKIHFKKFNYSDIAIRVPNIDKISKLGYIPQTNLRDGISKYFQWIKSTKSDQLNLLR